MKKIPFLRRFHWKMALMRILINAIVLVVIVLVVPFIRFVDPSLLSIVLLAVALGVLNALVKPLLQFVFLPLIFASYGLVIVLVNTLLLFLLSLLFPASFAVERLLWALVAGALIGLLGTLLENLFGLIPPIVPDEETGLRRQFLDRPVGSLGGMLVTRRLPEEEQLAIEAPEIGSQSIEPGLATGIPEGVAESETSAPFVPPAGQVQSEVDVAPAPLAGTSDASSSPPAEGPEPPITEEGE
jgi:putative membrane protein